MDMLNKISDMMIEAEQDGWEPKRILLGLYAYTLLLAEMNQDNVSLLYDLPFELSHNIGTSEIALSCCESDEVNPLYTPCPSCGYLSYSNEYCGYCGIFREYDADNEQRDLVDLISCQGEAIGYGFSLVEDS